MSLLTRLLRIDDADTDTRAERERIRERLREQERRVQALGRVVEVIQRRLAEERPHADR